MAIVDILKQINDAEEEAENIVLRARAKIADIDKDTAIKIDKINAECDVEIAARIKNMVPPAAVRNTDAKITVSNEKINAAVELGTKEFFARVGIV
jgi:hypothetical protein